MLEKHPQACRLYLIVDKPAVLLSAQVNMPITTGQTIINYANEEPDPTTLYRTWEKLSAGNTVKIGTTRGGQQLGTVTLSSAGPAQIVVGSNTKAWSNGLYLSVGTSWYARVTALGKDVNGRFNGGAMLIPYDNASGDYTKVKAGMTLYLGSTPGGRDLGRVRVKSITASLIIVAMNSDVQWADNAYITIVESVDLWSIYPRINPYSGKWYKDEIAYATNVYQKQTVWLPPVPIMGPPGVAFLDDNDEATLKFIGAESYTLCSNGIKLSATQSVGDVSCVIGMGWNFADGTVVSGSANQLGTEASPNVVKWTSAGRRLVSLNVKNDKPSGYEKSTTGYRPVFILNRPGTAGGVNEPYMDFNIETLEGDFDSGGWTATVRVFGDADIEEFPDNAMIVIFAEEWWGGGPYGQTPQAATQQSIGGYPGRENVKLVAWIMEETTHVGFAADGERYVEFRVQTIDGLLKSIAGYIMSMEDRIHSYGTDASTSCTEWWHVFKLQVNRTIQYVTAFHTTLHQMSDVYIANDNSRVWAWDFGDGSLYRQIDDYAASAIAARLLCSKQSQLFIERDIQTAPAGWQPNYVVMALDKDTHLREKLELPRPHRGRVRRVDLEGLIWNGSVATPIIARAPGVAPNQDGVDESLSGYVAESRSEFEEIAGYMLAAKNNPWTGLPFRFQGNFSFLDIAPQGWLTLSLAATDNKRGIAWTNKKLVPRRVTMNYDARSQTLLVDAVMDAEAGGSPGVTGGYTPPPPVTYPDTPSSPVNVPGWNNTIYAGTTDGIYKIQVGTRDWYPIIERDQPPFDEMSFWRVDDLLIDPRVKSYGVNTDLIAIIGDGEFPYSLVNAKPYRGSLDLLTNKYSWTRWDIGDPPNSWNDNPAPTLAACQLTSLRADWCNTGVFYFAAFYWTGSQGRSWLCKVVDSGGTVVASWMPLAWDYPSLTRPFSVIDMAVDTQDGSQIYITGQSLAHPYKSGLFVISSGLSLIRKVEDMSPNAIQVAVPWYRSGGSRNKNHVILYGSDIAIGANLYNAIYSTDGGASFSPLNTRTGGSYVYQLYCDAVNENDFVAFTSITNGPIYTHYIQSFTSWGTDWDLTPKTVIPIAYWNVCAACPRGPSPIVLAGTDYSLNYRFSEMVLIFERGSGFAKIDVSGLSAAGMALALDWGK